MYCMEKAFLTLCMPVHICAHVCTGAFLNSSTSDILRQDLPVDIEPSGLSLPAGEAESSGGPLFPPPW